MMPEAVTLAVCSTTIASALGVGPSSPPPPHLTASSSSREPFPSASCEISLLTKRGSLKLLRYRSSSSHRAPASVVTVASSNIFEAALTRLYNSTRSIAASENLSTLLSHATRSLEHVFGGSQSSPRADGPLTTQEKLEDYVNLFSDFLAGRSALENTSLLLALCTFLVLAMSWTSRLGNLGRFSPFSRSPTDSNSARVSDADFSYIAADDLRQHQAEINNHQQKRAGSPTDFGPPRDTDVLLLKNKKKEYAVHFPAYSIAKGELTIGQVREQAAKKVGTGDTRRVRLLYKGRNLKDDQRTCKQEGLKDGAEILCSVAEAIPSASGSEDEQEDDEFGEIDGAGADGETKRRRNRGNKTKRRNKREQKTSGTSTPVENLGVPPQTSRAPSPKPTASPATPMDKLNALHQTLRGFLPACEQFRKNPPTDPAKRDFEYKRLSETILTQVLLKLDGVESEGDEEARLRRKELVKETQSVLNELDAAIKAMKANQ